MKNVKHLPKVRDRWQQRATKRGARHKINEPGTKIGRAVERFLGLPMEVRGNTIFHGGELTAAATERRRARFKRKFGTMPWLG